MRKLPRVEHMEQVRLGKDPAFDAWFYTFRAENNIEHHINQNAVAGDEQLAFMVHLPPNAIYAPCSDAVFGEVMESYNRRALTPALLRQYAGIWRMVVRLVHSRFQESARRRDMLNYCRHRFLGCLALRCILPSRLAKRLVTTITSQSGMDIWAEARLQQNASAAALMKALVLRTALDVLPAALPLTDLPTLLRRLELTRLARQLYLAACASREEPPQDADTLAASLSAHADVFVPRLEELFARQSREGSATRVILYLCSSNGGLIYDLAVVNTLLRMGHKVVLALKDEPHFLAPQADDFERDPLLAAYLPQAVLLRDKSLTKNELLRRLRERRLVIISDGTGESLNLYRTSITFARAWKECDMVLAKGERTASILLETSSRFTRDVFCFWCDNSDITTEKVRMSLKPRPGDLRKFSEEDLNAKAEGIIRDMRAARDQGRAVMFYSCIIGSIPGETRTAIAAAHAFVTYLRESLADPDGGGAFVINPAEHFEPGMDGDDLMFMWETVQRSGLINIWRFQSTSDVEHSFRLLQRHMPPVWYGKDATFSTGCTKEMRIALDMQRQHPELQIIGPDSEKFFRRANYGVGKIFDAKLR